MSMFVLISRILYSDWPFDFSTSCTIPVWYVHQTLALHEGLVSLRLLFMPGYRQEESAAEYLHRGW